MAHSSDTQKEGSRKLLWIGWDGADWDHITPLLDQGLLPNLEKLINEGVMGNLATLQPVLSPMLWNSAATGKYPFDHGIFGFTEPDPSTGGVRPFSSYSRESKAIWNIFSSQGLKSNVINWWASHPAEKINGCVVSNLFHGIKKGTLTGKGTIHPEERAKDLRPFKVYPEEIGADQILPFIPLANKIDQDEDGRLDTFSKTLAETLTTHSVATAVMEMEPWDFMAVYYTCIDHFGHGFMPYYPPRMPHISEEDVEMFKDVIPGAYRFSDMMLGRMMEFCDDDTTIVVCSDHGFKSGADRPIGQPREPAGPTVWHRDYGMIVMKGPNIKKDERIYGASLIDIAPTLLTIMGLPVGQDMAGRILTDAFIDPPSIPPIPSWEDHEGEFDDGIHQTQEELPPEEAEDLINQFVALGYIDDPTGDKEEQYEAVELESKYNCAQSYMFAHRPDEALPLFEEITRRASWESRFISQLANCYQQCGYLKQAQRTLESAFDLDTTRALGMPIQWIEIRIAMGDRSSELFARLEKTEQLIQRQAPQLLTRIGRIHASLRKWEDAQRAYEGALEHDPANVYALQALSRIYCRLNRNHEAANAALDAVSLVYRLPHAHMNLGIAMAREGEYERAITAFHTALSFSPGFVLVHRLLALLYQNRLGKRDLAQQHHQAAKEYHRIQNNQLTSFSDRVDKEFPLPEIAPEKDRKRILIEKRPDQTNKKKRSGKEFVLVSGLPRSGTSLMMQMLEAGGLPPKTDGERVADSDNPKGYYEWEAIKKVQDLPLLMEEPGLQKKAIKVISMLLQSMPYTHSYKVIFMNRPIREVVASQRTMITRLETEGAEQSEEDLAQTLEKHRSMILQWLEQHPRIEFLDVDYPSLVKNPKKIIPDLIDFLGTDLLPNTAALASVIDPSLKRQGN